MSKAFRAAIAASTRLKPWQWAAKNVRIANSERSPKYDPDQTPWWKQPMECAADSGTRQVVVVAPTGSGKSTMAEALIPYIVAEDPGPMLYACQTDADAKFWGESRLKPALMSCPSIAGLWPKDRHASRKLEIMFPHMPLILGGANLSNFQEKSVRWLFGDEVWAWKPGLLREFKARHHNRWNRKEFLVSQGSLAGEIDEDDEPVGGDEFWHEWMKTDQGCFSWMCPECKAEQPFDFAKIKFEKIERESGTIDEQASSKTARMSCRECEAEFPDDVQVRRKLAISNVDNGNGGYIATREGLDHLRGFRIDSTAVWWVPWADEVLAFLEATRIAKSGNVDKLRQFTQKRRADFWTDDLGMARVEVGKSADFSKPDHENGEQIEDEVARFATVDVGGDHYWMTICAWKQGGKCRVLWEGYHPSDGADETAMATLINCYNVDSRRVFLDIGYEQDRVLDLCVTHGWIGIKGDGNHQHFNHPAANGRQIEKLYSKIRRARAKSGGMAHFILIASNPIKDILARMVGNGDQLEFPADLSKTFENHMKCEKRIVEKHSKTGAEKVIWQRPHNRANHLWDCMCYQVAAALIFSVFDDV